MMNKAKQNNAAANVQAINIILNSLDALVYVSDIHTYELLYLNDYGLSVWGSAKDKKCYQILQSGQHAPCQFCTNHKLLDADGNPSGVYVWEFQNTQNGRWYQCRDQAIRWTDGRLVRIEIATDITDRKQIEHELMLAKAQAEKQADTDELTQLYNRRAFFNLGRQVVHQLYRTQQTLSIIMFDLDHFKRINDQWGHATGDAALIHVSQLAQKSVRASDILARLGGEEFGVLLPNATPEQAKLLAERMRSEFEQQAFQFNGRMIHCTASFGISSINLATARHELEPQDLLETLLNNADQAMMRAKQAGRNRVCELSSLLQSNLA